ncbi:MAG: YgfZ/GcvT domain-containing protein [Actinomycetota bacterium]
MAAVVPDLTPAEQIAALRTGCGVAAPPAGVVEVEGPDAVSLLQNLLTQDLDGLAAGEARRALLLTPKAKVVADLRVVDRGDGRLLLLTEPAAAAPLAAQLVRFRLAAKAEVRATGHWSVVRLVGPGAASVELPGTAVAGAFGDLPAVDHVVPTIGLMGSLDAAVRAGAVPVSEEALEALRVEAGAVRLGHDVDERWMPAEVGLVEAAVSFDKGCFIGQEPVTRLHRRGHANRAPRRLVLAGPVAPGAALVQGDREVGVVTSVAGPPWLDAVRATAIARVDLDPAAPLAADGVAARLAD